MRPQTLHKTLSKRSAVLQRLLVAVTIIAYITLFIGLYPMYGATISALSGIPAMATAYLYGKWYGLLGACLCVGLNLVLFMTVTSLTFEESIRHVLSIGSLMLIATAFIFGYMGDIAKELRQKIDDYEHNGQN